MAAQRIAVLPDRKDRDNSLNAKVVTDEEVWLLSLCADTCKVIAAEPATNEVVPGFASDTVDSLNRHFGHHRVHKTHKDVVPPTDELRQLRGLVPPN